MILNSEKAGRTRELSSCPCGAGSRDSGSKTNVVWLNWYLIALSSHFSHVCCTWFDLNYLQKELIQNITRGETKAPSLWVGAGHQPGSHALCIAPGGPSRAALPHRRLLKASYKRVCIVPLCSKGSQGKSSQEQQSSASSRPRNHSGMKMNGPHLRQGPQGGLCFFPKPFRKRDELRTKSQVQPAVRPTARDSCPGWLQRASSAGFHLFSLKLSEGGDKATTLMCR